MNLVSYRHKRASIYPGNGNDQNFQGGGGVFSKIFRPGGGGIFSEVSNFDRKSRFFSLIKP